MARPWVCDTPTRSPGSSAWFVSVKVLKGSVRVGGDTGQADYPLLSSAERTPPLPPPITYLFPSSLLLLRVAGLG